MPQYLSPGVYVEEVPSAVKPIAGVGTSTAGFIGQVPDSLEIPANFVKAEQIGIGDGSTTTFNLDHYPVLTTANFEIRVAGAAVTDAMLSNDDANKVSQVTFTTTAPASGAVIDGDYIVGISGEVRLCTNFSEFKKYFGDFSTDAGQRNLAHAVYGFFNNGGTRCWVTCVTDVTDVTAVTNALKGFEAIDEIALVAVPGSLDANTQTAVIDHCENAGDRFAILDGQRAISFTSADIQGTVRGSNYGALYFPWISVYDPVTKDNAYVPPSGHIAGLYARIDSERGVHKAPANAIIRGAVGVESRLSRADQMGLNPDGINVIRAFNGNITVWGARTLGGDGNDEWKYINVRRLFLFLRESIDKGTQWVVFEPNTPDLWAKITRNVTAFLTNIWRAGALFGAIPQQAFYVQCDAETNPPEVREQGQVVTEIGVAVVKPAEFVIFRISQWAGSGS